MAALQNGKRLVFRNFGTESNDMLSDDGLGMPLCGRMDL